MVAPSAPLLYVMGVGGGDVPSAAIREGLSSMMQTESLFGDIAVNGGEAAHLAYEPSWHKRLISCLVLAAACLPAGAHPSIDRPFEHQIPMQTLELREWLGVTHATQNVEFVLDHPAMPGAGTVLDETDTPVPFQLLEQGRKIAIQAGLRANSKRVWRWYPDRRRLLASPPRVQIKKTEEGWEISNELIGFRMPSEQSIKDQAQASGTSRLKPLADLFNYGPDVPRVYALAPLQGVRLRDGTWSALGPNTLVVLARQLTDAKLELLESGPLKIVVRLHYDFEKPAYTYGNQKISDSGPGYLAVTLTLLADQPSILIEEETDLEEVWSINFYVGLAPDQAQYQGHHSTDPKLGHMPDGSLYLANHLRKHYRGEPDATVDLQYLRPQTPSYVSSDQTWGFLAVWNPWIVDSGWYWQLYNRSAGQDSNLVSIFAGPASRALSPGMSGACIFTLPSDPRRPRELVAGISSQSYRRAQDGAIFHRSRFSWGLFLGIKGHDLSIPGQVPTVALQRNIFGGAVNLTKLAAMKFAFPDPPQGYGGLYMDKTALADVIQRVRQSRNKENGFYRWLYDSEPTSRALFDAWADESGMKMRAAAEDINQLAKDFVDDLANGQGIYTFRFQYWHGGLELMRRGLWVDQVLASNALDSEQKARVKAAASLFAYVLWDNDFVPMDNSNGINLGTANMPQQQQGYRYFYAQLLVSHPDFAARASLVEDKVLLQLQQQINVAGAHFGSPHYISASFAPTLNTLMQIKQLGKSDPFRTEPRLAKFAEFYLNLLTPPELRFPGKPRSYIALGDSSTEASPLFGQLGTAFRDADPTLSRRLMAAWQVSGKPHSGFFGTTTMAIDDRLPSDNPALGSATFPGYYSVLRSGWGTSDETAAWIVNGDFYRDHRSNDSGNVVLYALGVPLSVHWGSMYSPQTPGAYYHSSIVLESELGRPWNQPSPPLDTAVDVVWHKSAEVGFATSAVVDTSVSKFLGNGIDWTRRLQIYRIDRSMPVITIRDTFEGNEASAPKIFSLNLLAMGPVRTPAGEITPERRTHPVDEKPSNKKQLVSASSIFLLPMGVADLVFTGQFGVDFEVFVIAREPQEALLGNWADSWTQQQSIPKWEERQHILRIRGTGTFQVIIVPFRAGHRPLDLKVKIVSDTIVLSANGTSLEISK